MTREEILEKSRKESNGRDEREQQVRLKAGSIARAVGVLVNLLMVEITIIFDGSREIIYASWAVYWGMMAADYLVQAISLKKGERWAAAILSTLALAFFVWKFMTLMIPGV